MGIKLNEEESRTIVLLSGKEKTTARCADWSKAEHVQTYYRQDGGAELLFKCSGYSFYTVKHWRVDNITHNAYDEVILNELVAQKKKEK